MLTSATFANFFPARQQKTKSRTYTASRTVSGVETKKLWLGTSLAVVIIVMSIAHLFSVNYNVGIGYNISTAQKKVAALKEENKRLMLKSSETGSIASIQENFAAGSYVPVTSIEYVNAHTDTSVSMK